MSQRTLDELFDAAQDIPPARRAAWIDAACAGDEALRQGLQRLLDAEARVDGILESGRLLLCEVIAEETLVPSRFGPWHVLRSLGSGGMGDVWLVERNDAGFVQRAAVKQVAWPTPGLLQRFRNERQILARLEHPGIARLIDGGVDASGCPYLAMEYVAGARIDVWVRERKLDARAIVRLLLQVCDAMQFAHRNLVVHSDIKPSNILVGDDGKPRLLDFGIAWALSAGGEAETRSTTLLLTPDYAAPEWLAGGAPNTAVDIYALGVLTYELLSGSKPYRTRRDGATATPQLPDTPTRPPSAALNADAPNRRARQRALRGDLDRVVMTAMAREPERRFATVEAFASDLRSWLDGRAVAARGDRARYRLRKFVARNRVAVGAAALAACALIVATAFSVRQARVARQQAERADAVRDFLVGVFEQTSPERSRGHPITAQQLLDAGERQLDAGALESGAAHAGMGGLIGHLYWQIGDYRKALPLLQRAAASRDPLVPEDVRARNLLYLAQTEVEKESLTDAIAHARQAIAFARNAGAAGDDVLSGAHRVLAFALTQRGDAKLALPILTRALPADRKRFGNRSSAVSDDLLQLAWTTRELGDFASSIDHARQGIELAATLHGRASAQVIDGLETLASAQMHGGDLVASEAALREAVALAAKVFGPSHRETIVARSNLYLTLYRQNRFEDALAGHRSLLPLVEAIAKARPEQLAYTWNLIGLDLQALGRFDEAVDAGRQSLAAWEKVNGPDPDWSGNDSRVNAAMSLLLKGDLAASEALWRKVVQIDAAHEPSTSVWRNWHRGELGNVLRLRHRYRQAVIEIKAALDALPRAQKPDAFRAHLVSLLALAQLDAGDVDAAEQAAARASHAAEILYAKDALKASESGYAAARVQLARRQPAKAEPPLRAAVRARAEHHRNPSDPRMLEVEVALVRALEMQGKRAEAAPLRAKIEPLLVNSNSPYLADLRGRLQIGQ